MSKVILTKKQAEEIKKIEDVDYAINVLSLNKRPDNPLAELTIAEIARALYVGYEVEPEFKVGDWVVYEDKTLKLKHIGKYVKSVEDDYSMVDIEEFRVYQEIPNKFLRHATPCEIAEEKERRWWKKHGRGVWKLKVGDVLVDTDGEIQEVTSANVRTDGTVQYCIDYCAYSLEHIKGRFIVLVFKENRLDVKTNE